MSDKNGDQPEDVQEAGDPPSAEAMAGGGAVVAGSTSGDEEFRDVEDSPASGDEEAADDAQPTATDTLGADDADTAAGVDSAVCGALSNQNGAADESRLEAKGNAHPDPEEAPAEDGRASLQTEDTTNVPPEPKAMNFRASEDEDGPRLQDSANGSQLEEDGTADGSAEQREEDNVSDIGSPCNPPGLGATADGTASIMLQDAPVLDSVADASASEASDNGVADTEVVASPTGSGANLFSGSEDDIDEFHKSQEGVGTPWMGAADAQDAMASGSSTSADSTSAGAPQLSLEKLKGAMPSERAASGALSTASSVTASPLALVDDTDTQWQSKKKHFFVLSNAGKPVFSRYGSESGLAGFMGVICGMLSFMETTGDQMQSMRAGCHLFVFVCRGPLYLVAVSRSGEPEKCLMLQLEMLYHTIISILTNAVERMFRRSPSYDLRKLMGGTGTTMRSLIKSFARDPAAMLVSIPSMRLPSLQRRIVQDALGGACGPGQAMYALLLGGTKVVGLVEPKGSALHPHDVLLLSNFVRSNDSFRQAESFAPVCLPYFNSGAYLHAYIHYISPGVCLVLLASHPDTFSNLSTAREKIEHTLHSASVLETILKQLDEPGQGSPTVDQLPESAGGGPLGSTPLWHFAYRSPTKRQVVVAGFTSQLSRKAVYKEIVKEYGSLAAQMHDSKGNATQRSYLSTSNERVTLAVMYPDSELYAVYDPMTERAAALQVAQRVMSWAKGNQAELMIPLAS